MRTEFSFSLQKRRGDLYVVWWRSTGAHLSTERRFSVSRTTEG
jgi:hypothetical protein